MRICDAIAESFPPQCGGPSLRLAGYDVGTAAGVQEHEGVRWAENVSVFGTRDGDTLTVDNLSR